MPWATITPLPGAASTRAAARRASVAVVAVSQRHDHVDRRTHRDHKMAATALPTMSTDKAGSAFV
jgi:hypothetical protein